MGAWCRLFRGIYRPARVSRVSLTLLSNAAWLRSLTLRRFAEFTYRLWGHAFGANYVVVAATIVDRTADNINLWLGNRRVIWLLVDGPSRLAYGLAVVCVSGVVFVLQPFNDSADPHLKAISLSFGFDERRWARGV